MSGLLWKEMSPDDRRELCHRCWRAAGEDWDLGQTYLRQILKAERERPDDADLWRTYQFERDGRVYVITIDETDYEDVEPRP